MVLHFGTLMFISSSALRILLLAARKIKQKHGTFLLCGLAPHLMDVMKTAGFERLLQIRSRREEALEEATARAAATEDDEASVRHA